MTDFKADNVTSYEAGGGDNIVADGYIKTVEKIWMDSFTFSAVLTTADTLVIAKIPSNKKITDVMVTFPTGITPTTATINVGITGDTNKFIDAAVPVAESGAAGAQAARTVVRMNNTDGFQYVTTASTDIILSLGVTAMTAPTAGTITTIVKYT